MAEIEQVAGGRSSTLDGVAHDGVDRRAVGTGHHPGNPLLLEETPLGSRRQQVDDDRAIRPLRHAPADITECSAASEIVGDEEQDQVIALARQHGFDAGDDLAGVQMGIATTPTATVRVRPAARRAAFGSGR